MGRSLGCLNSGAGTWRSAPKFKNRTIKTEGCLSASVTMHPPVWAQGTQISNRIFILKNSREFRSRGNYSDTTQSPSRGFLAELQGTPSRGTPQMTSSVIVKTRISHLDPYSDDTLSDPWPTRIRCLAIETQDVCTDTLRQHLESPPGSSLISVVSKVMGKP